MPRNLIVRIGLDPSGYNSGMSKLPKTAETVSKKVKKALSATDISMAVSDALGMGSNPSARISQVTAANVDQARQQLQTLTEYRNQLRGIGFDDNTTDVQYGMISERIRELTYDISAYEAELQKQAQSQREAAQAAQDASQQEVAAAKDAAAAEQGKGQAVEESTGKTRRAIHPIRSLSQWIRSLWSHGSGMGKVSDGVRKIGSSAKYSDSHLGRMVSSIRRVAHASFAFRIAGAAMGRLRSIVNGYISENATLQAQVNGLKISMGQALAPAIQLVANAMSALLPYIVGVSNAIGQLMAALFGSGWTAAADGAKKTAAATGGAAKAQKEMNRQLMSFDEINKLSADNDSSGGGGGGAGSTITPIESKTPAWLERFKTTFSELFSSEEFQAANIGGKIGMSLQAGLDWLGGEGMRFDWRCVGKNLRDNFNSFFTADWWESLWKTSGIYFAGIGDFLAGLFQPEWEALKEVFSDNGTAAAAAFIGGLTVGLVFKVSDAMLGGAKAFGDGVAEYYEEQGNESAAGYWKGFSERAQKLQDYFKLIWDTIVGWAKEKLGIHSPSTVFAEIGGYCMEGLTKGISDKFSGVMDKLHELKYRVSSIADNLKSAFSFEWHMPTLKLPHLSVDWDPVDNVLARFFGVSAFPRLSVSWFAKGGILDGAQIFGRMGSSYLGGGEAGREAVLPLERNTGWMDMIAERVVSLLSSQNGGDVNVTIPVTLDKEVLTKIVVKGLRQRARANGGLAW